MCVLQSCSLPLVRVVVRQRICLVRTLASRVYPYADSTATHQTFGCCAEFVSASPRTGVRRGKRPPVAGRRARAARHDRLLISCIVYLFHGLEDPGYDPLGVRRPGRTTRHPRAAGRSGWHHEGTSARSGLDSPHAHHADERLLAVLWLLPDVLRRGGTANRPGAPTRRAGGFGR